MSLLGQFFIKTRSLDENDTHETKKDKVPNKFSHTTLMLIFFIKSCLDEIKNFKSLEVIPNFAHFMTTLKSRDEIVSRLGIQTWPKIRFGKSFEVIPNFAHFTTTLKTRDEIVSRLGIQT